MPINIKTIINTLYPKSKSYFTYLASSVSLRQKCKANGAYARVNHFADNFAITSHLLVSLTVKEF